MKYLTINNTQFYRAKKIIKKGNDIRLIDAEFKGENNEWIREGDILFPNISNLDAFVIVGEFDLSEEDKKMLYDVELDFRISLLEMGVNVNDL